jgi:2,4-dienoyl-CoA reductase-like NADH-dependent reductase (Old Yellow Enzyme family)
MKNGAHLNDPIRIGTMHLRNRLYRAPVLEGAGGAAEPWRVYARHFVPNCKAGLGLVVQGNTIVLPEGRTSLGMSAIGERADMVSLRPLTDAVHAAGGRIVIQLGHGGVFSLESWHREAMASRTRPPLAASRLPFWLRLVHTGVHVLSTREVGELAERFGVVSAWAREAGYDGVQLAASNAKLLHQFLSPTYNRRKDRYGGSVEGRARLLLEIREAIAREAGEDYPVLLKYAAEEPRRVGRGIPLEDGIEVARLAEQAGFAALTPVTTSALPNTALCRGGYPGKSFESKNLVAKLREASGRPSYVVGTRLAMWLAARRYPFEPVWNRHVFKAVRQAVSLPVFAVGGLRTPGEAAEILARGEADMIGIGRPFYAEPDLARRFLAAGSGDAMAPLSCESCNRCVVPQMLGMPGVCYNPEANKRKRSRGVGLEPSPSSRSSAPPAQARAWPAASATTPPAEERAGIVDGSAVR